MADAVIEAHFPLSENTLDNSVLLLACNCAIIRTHQRTRERTLRRRQGERIAARIFLSYAREDETQVRGVYRRFVDAGFEVWMDKIDLLPAQRWQQEIPRAIRTSDFILIFFSKNSLAKQGYIQREFRQALDTLDEMQPDAIHTIPLRLDDCQIPEQFHPLQWRDLSEEGEFDCMVQTLLWGMEQRQIVAPDPALEPPPDPIPDRGHTFSGASAGKCVASYHGPCLKWFTLNN